MADLFQTFRKRNGLERLAASEGVSTDNLDSLRNDYFLKSFTPMKSRYINLLYS